MGIIELDKVSKIYRGRYGEHVLALKDITLKVSSGEFIVLIGPSGSGKSTMLDIIAGLKDPSEGSISFKSEGDSDVGYVYQDYALFPWKTVEENLKMALKLSGSECSQEKVDRFLNMVGLSDFAKSYPQELSGGMKQRAAFARTLVYDPELILMDEPFSSLDELTREEMYGHFKEILSETDKTIIYVTHDISEAYMFADRIIVLSNEGTKVDEIKPDLEAPREIEEVYSEEFRKVRREILEKVEADINET